MKKFVAVLMFLGCLGFASSARAQITNTSPVSIVISSNTNCYGMTIGVTATNVILSTSSPHHSVYIENEDANANVFSSHNVGVTTSGGLRGKKIKPGNNWWSVVVGAFQPWFAISDTASTNIMVCLTN